MYLIDNVNLEFIRTDIKYCQICNKLRVHSIHRIKLLIKSCNSFQAIYLKSLDGISLHSLRNASFKLSFHATAFCAFFLEASIQHCSDANTKAEALHLTRGIKIPSENKPISLRFLAEAKCQLLHAKAIQAVRFKCQSTTSRLRGKQPRF